jgi:hypothetical protein
MRALLEANYMLLGYAVENSIKGYSIYKHTILHGLPGSCELKYLLTKIWKVRNGHDIISIAKNAGLFLSDEEIVVCQKVQEHSIWKGKYHIPNDHSEIQESILPGEKGKYTASDRHIVSELVRRIGVEVRQ